MKKYFSAFLCGVMLCCSHNVQAGLFEGLFLPCVSIGSHLAGSCASMFATCSFVRYCFIEEINKNKIKISAEADTTSIVKFFVKGNNTKEDLKEVVTFTLCSLGLHFLGILSSYAAGQITASHQKEISCVTKKRKLSKNKLTMKHAVQQS